MAVPRVTFLKDRTVLLLVLPISSSSTDRQYCYFLLKKAFNGSGCNNLISISGIITYLGQPSVEVKTRFSVGKVMN